MECDRPQPSETCGTPGAHPPPVVRAFLGMARLIHKVELLLSTQLRAHGMNAGQLDLLINVGAAEGQTQQELAARLCHSKANVSQLLDKMARAGLVRRVPQGRAYGLHLTDAGRDLLGRLLPEHERIIGEEFARLTPAERDTLFHLVGKIDPGRD